MPKYIGFDSTEGHRTGGGGTYDCRATCTKCEGKGHTGTRRTTPCKQCRGTGQLMYAISFPLREWGWDRPECVRTILSAGLPEPPKSACSICGASKKAEVRAMSSDVVQLGLNVEQNFINGRHYRGDGKVVGLGRHWKWEDQRDGK